MTQLFPCVAIDSFLAEVHSKMSRGYLGTVLDFLEECKDLSDVIIRVGSIITDISLMTEDTKRKCTPPDCDYSTESIIKGLLNSDPVAFRYSETDTSFLDTNGAPVFVIGTGLITQPQHEGDMVLSHIPGADLKDLHNLNGHSETRGSFLVCPRGVKLRFRVRQEGEGRLYNCYQFPGGGKLMKFRVGDNLEGRWVFADLLARVILNNIEGQLCRARAPANSKVLLEETVLRNGKTKKAVTLQTFNIAHLEKSVVKRFQRDRQALLDDEETERVDKICRG